MARRKTTSDSKSLSPVLVADQLLDDLRQMIEAARARVAAAANTELTLLYWRIGRRIHTEILSGERAPYGKAIVAALSQQLIADYGRGFTYTALTRMVAFFEAFPDERIVATLSQELSWSHFVELRPKVALGQGNCRNTVATIAKCSVRAAVSPRAGNRRFLRHCLRNWRGTVLKAP